MDGLVTHVVHIQQDAALELALEAELPPEYALRKRVLVEVADGLAKESLVAGSRANGFGDHREGVAQSAGEVNVIRGGDHVGVLAEAALDYIAAALAEEPIEDSETTANYRVAVGLECQPDT